jgi:hypothetical protein
MATKRAKSVDPLGLVSALIEAGKVDTVYHDVYLDRARTFLDAILSLEDFKRIERERAALAETSVAIARAMDKGDWPRVKELSGRGQALRQAVEGKDKLMHLGRDVYAATDPRLDPFSPGLLPFARIPTSDLPRLRTRAQSQLAALERADPPWQDFYGERGKAFQALALTTSPEAGETGEDPREAAAQALRAGDMSQLEKLAGELIAAVQPRVDLRTPGGRATASSAAVTPPSRELRVVHSADTLARARRLGLALRQLESRVELAPLRQYAWNPLFSDQTDQSGRIGVRQVPLPPGAPEAFRDRLEMLMIHPLVNSGGARHLPTLVAEDVLVEDFPDLGEDDQPAASALLATLGLASRRGLTRIAIERALFAHGARVVQEELGLDPRAFRLVCIPPDVHLRLGEAEGWGRQPLWTHFDGYLVMADGRLRALAGGNARFGGLYDLLGLSRDYDSDKVMARFAVVKRARMVAW